MHPNRVNEFTFCATPTTAAVKTAIEKLHELLYAYYGEDFAYQVCAKGSLLGSSCLTTGYVRPVLQEVTHGSH